MAYKKPTIAGYQLLVVLSEHAIGNSTNKREHFHQAEIAEAIKNGWVPHGSALQLDDGRVIQPFVLME